MKTFEDFYTDLKEDEVWFTNAGMGYKPETVQEVARDLFMACSADNTLNRPIGEMRKYFWNKLRKITPDKVRKPFELKEEKKESDPPLTGEARAARLKEWEEAIRKLPAIKSTPKLTSQMIEEEGGVRPKAVQPYPATSLTEFQKHQRHLEYLKANYDPRTSDKLPEWMPEDQWISVNYEV